MTCAGLIWSIKNGFFLTDAISDFVPMLLKTNARKTTDAIRGIKYSIRISAWRPFSGFLNFYRLFVSIYSNLAALLNAKLKKGGVISFHEDRTRFAIVQQLRELLKTPPDLIFPKRERGFILDTDARSGEMGYVWQQKQDFKPHRLIGCYCRGMNDAERQSDTTYREYFGVALIELVVCLYVGVVGLQSEQTIENAYGYLTRSRVSGNWQDGDVTWWSSGQTLYIAPMFFINQHTHYRVLQPKRAETYELVRTE